MEYTVWTTALANRARPNKPLDVRFSSCPRSFTIGGRIFTRPRHRNL